MTLPHKSEWSCLAPHPFSIALIVSGARDISRQPDDLPSSELEDEEEKVSVNYDIADLASGAEILFDGI